MRGVIFCVVIFLNLPVAAIDYNDFPPNLQKLLDDRIDEVISSGGVCIAGRVTMDNGAHINSGKDVQVNFCHGVDKPLWVYDGGWFIMGRTLQSGHRARPARLVLRAFGYDPIDASIAIIEGEMTYVEFVMHETPYEELASVAGTVMNEQNEPLNGAKVSLSFPLSNHGVNEKPSMSIKTGPDGQYSFEDLSTTEHRILVSTSGYAYRSVRVTPPAGEITIKDLTLYRNRKVVIDYVYQADGSHNFTSGELQEGTIEWVHGHGPGGIDFSDGEVEGYEPESLRDIEMKQDGGMLDFRIFYCNGKNGFYDAGAVDFESVTEAAETGYSAETKPCVVGHTYIVRTYEDNYAKFIVISISEE
jgi:hypothetical protein